MSEESKRGKQKSALAAPRSHLHDIDNERLENLMGNGLLLEQQTRLIFELFHRDLFEKGLSEPVHTMVSFPQSSVRYIHTDEHGESYPTDLDVLARIPVVYKESRFRVTIPPTEDRRRAGYRATESASRMVEYLFLIECKGSPSSGMLLNRAISIPENHKRLIATGNSSVLQAKEFGVEGADWADFYRPQDKDGEKTYIQGHSKFWDATDQVLASMDSLLPDEIRKQPPFELYCVVPMIVTNAPICSMYIESKDVTFKIRPWVKYHVVRHYRPRSVRKDISEWIYVVNSKFLLEFLGKFVQIEADLTPEKYQVEELHSLDMIKKLLQ